jgi:hypothetical protein
MNSIRRHLSYANIVATLALVFAMGGSAVAANHYLINSTKQINPKVLRKLKGNTGKRGRAGPQGPAGSLGATGLQGAKGTEGGKGAEGPAGQSALSPLPSGQSESGDYAIRPDNTATAGEVEEAVTFPIRLAAVIPFDKVVWTPTGTATHCSGPGHADPGYLCVYSDEHGSLESPEVRNQEGPFAEGTGHFGFVLDWLVKGPDAIDIGTYTVTAP